MKKFNKKTIAILGAVTLSLVTLALPAFAVETNTPNLNGMMGGNMQTVMSSRSMQEAINTGDITKMAEAMNTPEVKALMGEEHVNQMTEAMKNGNMQSMMGVNGQGGMMGGSTGNMMGNIKTSGSF